MKIDIDFADWHQLFELMDNADKYPDMLFGTNSCNESVHTSIFKNRIVTETFQTNGWIRTNIYERIGNDIIRSETFEKIDV